MRGPVLHSVAAIKVEPADNNDSAEWEGSNPLSEAPATSPPVSNTQLVQLQDGSYIYVTSSASVSNSGKTSPSTTKKTQPAKKSTTKKSTTKKKTMTKTASTDTRKKETASAKVGKNSSKKKPNATEDEGSCRTGATSEETYSSPLSQKILEEAGEEEKQELMKKLLPPEMRLKVGKSKKDRLG